VIRDSWGVSEREWELDGETRSLALPRTSSYARGLKALGNQEIFLGIITASKNKVQKSSEARCNQSAISSPQPDRKKRTGSLRSHGESSEEV